MGAARRHGDASGDSRGSDDDPDDAEHDDRTSEEDLADDAAGDDEEGDGGEVDGSVPAPARRRSLGDRVRAGAASRPTSARPAPAASTKAVIEGLEPRERLFSFVGAGVSVVMGVTTYLVETNDHHFRLAKGQLTPQTTLVLGLVLGALLLGATLWGRRAPIGFVALFAFLGFGLPYGLPFLALAVWLLFRSYKFQKDATAAARVAKADRPAGSGRTAATRTSTGRSSTRAEAAKGAPRATRAKAAAVPEGNKRYTPKRPPPPAPKPSRRDRKATKAAD